MKTKLETKLVVKQIETLTLAPYGKSLVAYDFNSAAYQTLTKPTPVWNFLEWTNTKTHTWGADEFWTSTYQIKLGPYDAYEKGMWT